MLDPLWSGLIQTLSNERRQTGGESKSRKEKSELTKALVRTSIVSGTSTTIKEVKHEPSNSNRSTCRF
jgi:hypothetical protein